MEKVMILGARRGLGQAVTEKVPQYFPNTEVIVTSRREFNSPFRTLQCDFSVESQVDELIQFLQEWKPQRLFCFTGGGPFGRFDEKEFKDHAWSWRVTFESPARILHAHMRACPSGQTILTGSAIAEGAPDANASSYAASKHALRGLISSIRAENPIRDVRLFSPGYMDTDMLPVNSAPRKEGSVIGPALVADDFLKWATDPQASWHRICRP